MYTFFLQAAAESPTIADVQRFFRWISAMISARSGRRPRVSCIAPRATRGTGKPLPYDVLKRRYLTCEMRR